MRTLAQAEFQNLQLGELDHLPAAGSYLESPYVFDATAPELKEMAEAGLLHVETEETTAVGAEPLIRRTSFRRLK